MNDTNRNHADDIAYFLSFCIEQYKAGHNLSGEDAHRLLSSTGTLDYLADNYDVIHTQSPQWILQDINDFVTRHQL